jgi:hypothetical protein
MSFPDLQRYADSSLGSVYHSEAEGVPADGINEFAHNLNPEFIRKHEDELEFHVWLGTSIDSVTLLGLSSDYTKVRMAFVQTGADVARVRAVFIHSTPY